VSRRRTGSTSSAGAIPHPPVVDVASVVEKLRAIEHRFAPPSGSDARALRAQLDAWRTREPDEDLEFEIPESFARVLFTKLCERYEVTAHRHTGDSLKICVRMPHGFARTFSGRSTTQWVQRSHGSCTARSRTCSHLG